MPKIPITKKDQEITGLTVIKGKLYHYEKAVDIISISNGIKYLIAISNGIKYLTDFLQKSTKQQKFSWAQHSFL